MNHLESLKNTNLQVIYKSVKNQSNNRQLIQNKYEFHILLVYSIFSP